MWVIVSGTSTNRPPKLLPSAGTQRGSSPFLDWRLSTVKYGGFFLSAISRALGRRTDSIQMKTVRHLSIYISNESGFLFLYLHRGMQILNDEHRYCMRLCLRIVALNDILYIYSTHRLSSISLVSESLNRQETGTFKGSKRFPLFTKHCVIADRCWEQSTEIYIFKASTMSTIITTWVLEGVSSNVKPTEDYYLTPMSFFNSTKRFSHHQVMVFCFPARNFPLLVHSHSIHFSSNTADGCFQQHYTTALHHMEDRQS